MFLRWGRRMGMQMGGMDMLFDGWFWVTCLLFSCWILVRADAGEDVMGIGLCDRGSVASVSLRHSRHFKKPYSPFVWLFRFTFTYVQS